MLGDIMVAQTHQVTRALEQYAHDSGLLAASETLRDYSNPTDNGLAFPDRYIAQQYTKAQSEAPTKVVILCAGGADVLGGYCPTPVDASCQSLVDAATAASDLLDQMARDGVKDVLWAFYPDPTDAAIRAKMDVLRPMVQSRCDNATVPCHWIDLRATFEGHYADYVHSDGMTPTDSGSQAMATAIWSTMQLECIAR